MLLIYACCISLLCVKCFSLDLDNDTKKVTNSSHDNATHYLTIIGWQWETVGKIFTDGILLSAGAIVKIAYHNTRLLRTQIPESCVLLILGTIIGYIFYATNLEGNENIPNFTPQKFFYIYLPPIILESAHTLYDRSFIDNLGTILLLAILGTLINIFSIGFSLFYSSKMELFHPSNMSLIECLTFSTLISAVDPVAVIAIFQEVNINKPLYFLVFGESLFNDAVVITLYNTMTTFASSYSIKPIDIIMAFVSFGAVSLGGIVCGTIFGSFTAILTRFSKKSRVIEPFVVLSLAYTSYITAELFHLSGIISLTCCGLLQIGYSNHNVSKKSKTTIKYVTKTLSSISDVIIFLYLGMVLLGHSHVWNISFFIFTIVFCIVYRFMAVYLLSYIVNNMFQRIRIINHEEQFLMAYSGLRGAIAFALAIMLQPKYITESDLFVSTTLVVILFTVLIQGTATKFMVRLLQIQTVNNKKDGPLEVVNYKVVDIAMNGIISLVGQRSCSIFFNRMMKELDKKVLKRCLLDKPIHSFIKLLSSSENKKFSSLDSSNELFVVKEFLPMDRAQENFTRRNRLSRIYDARETPVMPLPSYALNGSLTRYNYYHNNAKYIPKSLPNKFSNRRLSQEENSVYFNNMLNHLDMYT